MIVDPDFLTHWKTRMLTSELSDKSAPVYVLALWAYCQQRRTDTFVCLAANTLKAICHYEGEADELRAAFERCGFLDVDGDAVVVHGWAERNAKLIANWINGCKGGRPLRNKEPSGNPTETQVPDGLTHKEPMREEQKRRDQTSPKNGAHPKPSGYHYNRNAGTFNADKAGKYGGNVIRSDR